MIPHFTGARKPRRIVYYFLIVNTDYVEKDAVVFAFIDRFFATLRMTERENDRTLLGKAPLSLWARPRCRPG